MNVGILAFLMDCVIGDPRSKFHPVVLIGKLIAGLETWLYSPEDSDKRKFWRGLFLMLLVLVICYGATAGIVYGVRRLGLPYLSWGVEALLLSFTISPRNLAEAGREIQRYLAAGDIEEARFKVGWIVGRDTDKLTVPEITRATVETIAENIVDGVISPLFFFFLGGVPLAVAYRAANTMDSMIGYKNEKYLFFGRAAARTDDAWNYIPARITGLLLVLAAWLLKYDWREAWRMMRRDAAKHPSPNGGFTEATVAGALGIRLGGLNYYFGRPSFRTYMGEPRQELSPRHISGAIRLMYAATILFLLAASGFTWLGRGGL
mgnify:FL=1